MVLGVGVQIRFWIGGLGFTWMRCRVDGRASLASAFSATWDLKWGRTPEGGTLTPWQGPWRQPMRCPLLYAHSYSDPLLSYHTQTWLLTQPSHSIHTCLSLHLWALLDCRGPESLLLALPPGETRQPGCGLVGALSAVSGSREGWSQSRMGQAAHRGATGLR